MTHPVSHSTNVGAALRETKSVGRVSNPFGYRHGREITDDYNEVNLLESDDAKRSKLEMWIAKNLGGELVKHYPNREWGVLVDLDGGMVVVTCPSVSQLKGYHLRMQNDSIVQLKPRVVRAAGEILERYGLSRRKDFDPDQIDALARNALDEAEGPDSRGEKQVDG